jgi:hypothetical protein
MQTRISVALPGHLRGDLMMRRYFAPMAIPIALLILCLSLANSAIAQCLLASSQGNNSVLKYDAATGAFVSAFVPSGSGGLTNPDGILFGQDHNLYVANSGNGTPEVLRYDGLTGAFLGIFVHPGNGAVRFTDMVWGPNGNLFVSDSGAHNVKEYNGLTGAFMRVYASQHLNSPQNLVFGPGGTLWVADGTNVVQFNPMTGAFSRILIPNGRGGLQTPVGLAFGLDGNLLVGDATGNSVLEYNSATGEFIGTFIPSGYGGLGAPHALVFRSGNLFIPDSYNNDVLEYDGTTGAFIGDFVTPNSGGLSVPTNLVYPPVGPTARCL